MDKIQERYTAESSASCNLSCGSNLEYLRLIHGEKVLDLGCGRGRDAIAAAKIVGPDGAVFGLDITPAMIGQATQLAENTGTTNVRFVLGDIENLPFMDNTFHAAMSNCVINHARDKQQVYREIHRVLKPGGCFVISDAVTKLPLPDSVKNDPHAWAECYGGAITREEYLDSIRSAGFTQLDILNQRGYDKNGYEFFSITLFGIKESAGTQP